MTLKPLAFAASAIAAVLLASVQGANAWYTRSHGIGCTVPGYTFNNTHFMIAYTGAMNDNDNASMTLYCPLPDSDEANKTTITTLNVHVRDGNNDTNAGVSARPCYANTTAMGATCGNSASTNSYGVNSDGSRTLAIGSHAAALYADRPNDYAYVEVTLPDDDLERSRVVGWYASN